MAKTNETPATPAAPVHAVFEIEDESKLKRGRQATPSVYHDAVRDAVEGKAYGIGVESKDDATKVLNELRKASQQTGRKLRTWNKADETPAYVAWKAVPAKADAAPTVPADAAQVADAPAAN